MERNGQVFVPALFWYELYNGLLSALRSRRITESAVDQAATHFDRLPVVTSSGTDPEARGRVMALARKHGLSFSDASYLGLALKLDCRLKSFDTHLLTLKGRYRQIM